MRQDLDAAALQQIREIARLRYAADLVPAAFGDYLSQNSKALYEIQRVPAADDPMISRIEAVREREYMLVDTVNEYYGGLYYDLSVPYEDWRKMSREEAIRDQELHR